MLSTKPFRQYRGYRVKPNTRQITSLSAPPSSNWVGFYLQKNILKLFAKLFDNQL